ncbi:MAG: dihydrofolate reductase [Lachnospiraceae bacterium]|nr:dihydrofolate reductase [Lachnospiraceae bacterium]
MNIIAAVDNNWGIGYRNRLLNSIPEDMRFFRETTTGKVVVMGRNTLESFPGKRPLKNRVNIVLTGKEDFTAGDAVIVHSLEEALQELSKYPDEDIYIIGGESVYRQFLPYCDTAHITAMDNTYAADAFFPNLDEDPEWEVAGESEERTYFDLPYVFKLYKRKKNLDF